MGKKLNALAEGSSDSQLIAAIRDSANQIWLAGLGAFAKAQAGGGKVFEALVREGQVVHQRTRKAADVKVAEVKAKTTGTWDKLEKVFEDRVARALHSLNVPTRKDIDGLAERVAELTEVTRQLAAAPRRAAAPRIAAKKT